MQTFFSKSKPINVSAAIVILFGLSSIAMAEEIGSGYSDNYSDNVLVAMFETRVDAISASKNAAVLTRESSKIERSVGAIHGQINSELDNLIAQRLDSLLNEVK